MKKAQYRQITLQSGEVVTLVDKEKYLLCEKIRNWILRLNYEQRVPKWMAIMKAAKKFGVPESYARTALSQWKHWCYDNGIRHRPLELFIADNEQQLKSEEQ